MLIKWFRSELDYDLGAAAWLAYHGHPELDLHRRHQIADICEANNRNLVSRWLSEAFARVGHTLGFVVDGASAVSDNILQEPLSYSVDCSELRLRASVLPFIQARIHVFAVSFVLSLWYAGWLPKESALEQERAESALAAAASAIKSRHHCRRQIPPF